MPSHTMNGHEIDGHKDRDEVISGLERISGRMRVVSMLIMTTTLSNMVLTLWTVHRISISDLSRWGASEMTVFILFCTIVAIMAAIGFDFLKRTGDAYFEELSDELHGSKISDKEYSLKGRIIMRGYSNHASLPLIPGRFGPGIIAGVNLLLPFLTLIFVTMDTRF
uniref:Uncharacterized protein n=1 Tax=Candidatus Kentrum sp. LFY TaxID=2126342 RepID=A0A450UGK1_9GAMM|nr:MAG: hypothetical protein BECKLFY1418A_GA0070994_101736 [Candidatus Kentron sp. LFY]